MSRKGALIADGQESSREIITEVMAAMITEVTAAGGKREGGSLCSPFLFLRVICSEAA